MFMYNFVNVFPFLFDVACGIKGRALCEKTMGRYSKFSSIR